jgi:hypothetical protein
VSVSVSVPESVVASVSLPASESVASVVASVSLPASVASVPAVSVVASLALSIASVSVAPVSLSVALSLSLAPLAEAEAEAEAEADGSSVLRPSEPPAEALVIAVALKFEVPSASGSAQPARRSRGVVRSEQVRVMAFVGARRRAGRACTSICGRSQARRTNSRISP